MLLSLGKGHHLSTLMQTLGRVTGNNRDVLDANGAIVTVLITNKDLTACNKMQNYINEISYRVGKGDTISQAMTGANKKMSDGANFFRHTAR